MASGLTKFMLFANLLAASLFILASMANAALPNRNGNGSAIPLLQNLLGNALRYHPYTRNINTVQKVYRQYTKHTKTARTIGNMAKMAEAAAAKHRGAGNTRIGVVYMDADGEAEHGNEFDEQHGMDIEKGEKEYGKNKGFEKEYFLQQYKDRFHVAPNKSQVNVEELGKMKLNGAREGGAKFPPSLREKVPQKIEMRENQMLEHHLQNSAFGIA